MSKPRTLQDLVRSAQQAWGTSIRQLALQARGAGYAIVPTTLSAIEAGTYKSKPSESTIRAIGWLAKVSDETAFRAAGQPVPGPPLADELPPGSDILPPRTRKTVVDFLRLLVEYENSRRAQEDSDAIDEQRYQTERQVEFVTYLIRQINDLATDRPVDEEVNELARWANAAYEQLNRKWTPAPLSEVESFQPGEWDIGLGEVEGGPVYDPGPPFATDNEVADLEARRNKQAADAATQWPPPDPAELGRGPHADNPEDLIDDDQGSNVDIPRAASRREIDEGDDTPG